MDREVRYLMWWVAALPLCPAELRCSDSNFNNFDQFSISHQPPVGNSHSLRFLSKTTKTMNVECWGQKQSPIPHSLFSFPPGLSHQFIYAPYPKQKSPYPDWLIPAQDTGQMKFPTAVTSTPFSIPSLPPYKEWQSTFIRSLNGDHWLGMTVWGAATKQYHIMEQRSCPMDRLIDPIIRWFILAIDRDREITTTSWSILCITMIPSIKNLLTVIDVNEIWIRIKSELESESEKELESSIENVIGSLKPLLQNSLRPVNNVKLHRSITYIERLDLQKERLLGVGSVHSERFGLLATWHEDWRN